MDGLVATLTVLAVLGSGLMAGVFFAFGRRAVVGRLAGL